MQCHMQPAQAGRRVCHLEGAWCSAWDTRAPLGRRWAQAAGAAADLSLLELEKTLAAPVADMVAMALPSADKNACAGASLPAPKRHECLT